MKYTYGKVTDQIIDELRAVVGADNVITKKGEMEAYSHDEMPRAKRYSPQVVITPTSAEAISRLMKLSNKWKIPVTPRGAGTGLTGGCVPIHKGIILSLERMNEIFEIDKENSAAVVGSGVTLSDLCCEVEKQGLYSPIHTGEMTATIGGIISTNAGGLNAVKYGVTRHNVLGLEIVMPNGEIITIGGKYVKCSTGYDLTQLIIGSEGTLAVVTKAILKLIKKPGRREILFAPFTNLESALDAVPDIMKLNMTPTSVEFMEGSIIRLVEKYLYIEIPHRQHDAYLMITIEGESEQQIYEYFSEVEQICMRHESIEVMVPGSGKAQRTLLDAREKFFHAIQQYAPMDVIDTVVPRKWIKEFVSRANKISEEFKIPLIVYGHAGDGNVHIHPICLDMDQNEWSLKVHHLMSKIYELGKSFGGMVSGEHGIGLGKKIYFRQSTDMALLNAMKRIKKAFDPDNILNPGKIFDL